MAWQTFEAARAARSIYAAEASAGTRQLVADIRASGIDTLTGIAKALQARGIKTPRGNTTWQAAHVARLIGQPMIANLEAVVALAGQSERLCLHFEAFVADDYYQESTKRPPRPVLLYAPLPPSDRPLPLTARVMSLIEPNRTSTGGV